MKSLIDKAKLLQELVESYDVESGDKVSPVKIYNLILAQKEEEPLIGYWYPARDGDGWICSNCGEDICYLEFEGERERFCRNCGAEMINAPEFSCADKRAWRLK